MGSSPITLIQHGMAVIDKGQAKPRVLPEHVVKLLILSSNYR